MLKSKLQEGLQAKSMERTTELIETQKCWSCGNADCTCDEETMQLMDEEARRAEQKEREWHENLNQ